MCDAQLSLWKWKDEKIRSKMTHSSSSSQD